ncbi:MAG: substrate-binding domain-containing protein [Thermoproteales archaeon]|nr:substrate-binding domain-containing protein [Thermoproteales archaeon]
MLRRGYLMFATGLLLGLVAASLLARVYGVGRGGAIEGRPEEIELILLYTSEKEGWLNAVKPLFEKWFYEKYGIRLRLVLYVTGSHESVNLILRGSVKPDVWSPASSIWIPYLNERWGELHGGRIAGEWYPLVLSPLVIAGWSDLVEEYGVRSFRDLYRLAKAGVNFKYGHTDPLLSNSGALTLLLEFCEAANKTPDQLTVDDIRDPRVLEFVRTIESKAVYYGKSTGFLGSWAAENGPQAISFFTVYENVVISNSLKARAKWGVGLRAVYPSIGVIYSDHPLVMIDAPWVDEWKRLAARELLLFLLQPHVQELAEKYGFRPVNPLVPLDPEAFSPENGVVPKIPVPALKPPSGEVLEAILEAWVEVRNPGV